MTQEDVGRKSAGRQPITPEDIARRYATRPGFRLATYHEVGLPLWEISVRCLTLAHRALPPLQEFALKTLAAGLSTEREIAAFLGLNEAHVVAVVADLLVKDYLLPTEADAFDLTPIGRRTVEELEELRPEQRVYPFLFDGLTRQLVRVGNAPLYSSFELRGEGIQEIPAFPKDPPSIEDLSTVEVARLLNEAAGPSVVKRDTLALLGIEGQRRRQFLRAVALVYTSLEDAEPVVEFAIDGRLSDAHARAFAQAEGSRKLGIVRALHRSGEEVASVLPRDILEQATDSPEVEAIRRTSESLRQTVEDLRLQVDAAGEGPEKDKLASKLIETSQQLAESDGALASLPVRPIEVYEHPPLLQAAFEEAASRLLIVSPWIRAGVVDRVFLGRLESTLRRGVEVLIGYGSGDDSDATPRDRQAERSLFALSRQYPNLIVGRLGDTHAKVLAVDDKYVVVTSFNWLSFKGDPNMPFRDERGMLVALPEPVEKVVASFMSRIVDAAQVVVTDT